MQFTFDYYDIQKALELLVKDKLGKHLEFDDSAELTIYVSGERE